MPTVRIPHGPATAVFLAAWLMPWRPAFKTRATASRLSFFVHHRDIIGRHIAKYGTHEPIPTRWLDNYLAGMPAGLFVDIGANLGWHTVHAAQHTSVETVVAFEPDPFNAWLLDRNLTENVVESVIVSNAAVGAQCGSVRLHRYKSSNCGRHALLADYGFGSRMVPLVDRHRAGKTRARKPAGECSQDRRRGFTSPPSLPAQGKHSIALPPCSSNIRRT